MLLCGIGDDVFGDEAAPLFGGSQAEPMGATVVLLAALFDDNLRAVAVRGGLANRLSILDLPICHVPHDEIIPGVFAAGDVSDLVGALAPLPLRMEEMVDGQNRRAGGQAAKESLADWFERRFPRE